MNRDQLIAELVEALRGLLTMPDFDGTSATSKVRLTKVKAARAAIKKGEAPCTV